VPRFAANLTMMYNEVPFLDRFAAAAKAGFKGVEFLFPYEYPREVVAERVREAGVEIALFNMPPGNWAGGERGIACIPGREKEFREGVDKALAYATHLGLKRLHPMAGIMPAGADRATCKATYIANIRYAAESVGKHGITCVIEPINNRDIPGFFLNYQAESAEVCETIGAPYLKMQMDLYHMQVMEGDIAMKLKKYASRCGHVQIAGAPERNEPDTGEIRYEYLLRVLDEIGYDGWVGCEYRPAKGTVEGLGWFKRRA
jgi:hydroxypyruvate isomerase